MKKINILSQKNKEQELQEEEDYLRNAEELDSDIDIIILDPTTHSRIIDIINEHVDHASRTNTDVPTLLNNILMDIITNYNEEIIDILI